MLNAPAFLPALAAEALPAAIVDLDAVDHNLAILREAMGDRVWMRVASKSVRVPWLLRYVLDADPKLRGLLCYTPREAELLADQGFSDLLIAYPIATRDEADALARLAARDVGATGMVDAPEQLPVLIEAAERAGVVISLCLDVDGSWRPLGALAHVGVRRSPLRDVGAARALARHVAAEPSLRLVGVMSYEAQVAGLPDRPAGAAWMAPLIRLLKAGSVPAVARVRAAVVDALRADGHAIGLVNGGGTGSLRSTAADPSVTEVTAGSGFLCPHLFDGYRDLPLRPAAFFALPVVRAPDPGVVTCAGGGYVASGAAGVDRLPIVHWPRGARPLPQEGFGEVQTPVRLPSGVSLGVGDAVICRHAKAGELMERFDRVLIVRGAEVVARAPTYRGLGGAFL